MADTTDITMSVGLDITEATKSANALKNVYSAIFDGIQKKAVSQLASIGKIQDKLSKMYESRAKLVGQRDSGLTINPKMDTSEIDGQIKHLESEIAQLENQFTMSTNVLGNIFTEMSAQQMSPFGPIIDDLMRMDEVSESTKQDIRGITGEMSGSERTAIMFNNAMNLIISSLTRLAQHPVKTTVSILKMTFSGLASVLKRTASTLSRIAGPIISKLNKGFKSLISSIKGKLNPSIKGTGNVLGNATGLLKKFILAGIGVRSIYFLFRKFWSMVKEGVNIMAQVDSDTNRALSNIATASYSLKKQFGSLFSTLVQAVAPAITAIINLLTRAIAVASQFFAALGGKSTYKKATTQVQDYAKSLDKSSKSTKKAKDENKKYMSGLDEIATWQDKNKDDDTDSGAGAGDLAGAYEDAPIESKLKGLADKFKDFMKHLKDLWDKGEFYQIGYDIAEALANGLDKIYDLIKWDNVKDKITYYCKAFTDIINGFIGNKHFWDSLGAVIGAGINTLIQTLYLLITGIHWTELGRSLATAFNRMISEIDWETAGKLIAEWFLILPKMIVGFVQKLDVKAVGDAISKFFINAFKTASDWIESVDWQELGHKVKELITSIDWAGIAETFFRLLGASLGALAGFLWGLIKDAFHSVVEWWNSNALDSEGKFTIEGLFNGIIEAIKTIDTWIKEHIFEPFITGFKNAFGIHSPSTVMKELGNFIMEGLLNGIKDKIEAFKQIWEDLKTTVVSIFEGMWNGVKVVINTMLGGIEKMANGIIKGLNGALGAINKLSFDVPDWVPEIGGKSIGFNLKEINTISIPKLAQGAVIPANSPFLAMLGDQKQGTNIEAPLETIKQAVADVLGSNGGKGGSYQFVAQLNRRTLFDEVISEAKLRQSATGRNPFEFA